MTCSVVGCSYLFLQAWSHIGLPMLLPMHVFSPLKPLNQTITFKDSHMICAQALMTDKQVVKVCRTVNYLEKAF